MININRAGLSWWEARGPLGRQAPFPTPLIAYTPAPQTGNLYLYKLDKRSGFDSQAGTDDCRKFSDCPTLSDESINQGPV